MVKKTIDIQLSNGVTLYVPDVEVEYYLDSETGKEEECIHCKEWRKVEDAIEHLFPGYFKRK